MSAAATGVHASKSFLVMPRAIQGRRLSNTCAHGECNATVKRPGGEGGDCHGRPGICCGPAAAGAGAAEHGRAPVVSVSSRGKATEVQAASVARHGAACQPGAAARLHITRARGGMPPSPTRDGIAQQHSTARRRRKQVIPCAPPSTAKDSIAWHSVPWCTFPRAPNTRLEGHTPA